MAHASIHDAYKKDGSGGQSLDSSHTDQAATARLTRLMAQKLAAMGAYEPVVAVFGKSGVGKSSLCNALFGKDLANISHVGACTRDPQEIKIDLSTISNVLQKNIKLIDFPGVGENKERDAEYAKLYHSSLDSIDLILWVLKADDRAFSSDLKFFNEVIEPSDFPNERLLIVVNQADKIEPVRQWNESECKPGPDQLANIAAKREYISHVFGVPETRITAVSSSERWRLSALSTDMVMAMPAEGRLGIYKALEKDVRTEEAKEATKAGIVDTVISFVKDKAPELIELALPIVWNFVRRYLAKVF